MRRLRYPILVAAVLALLLAGAWFWLLHTTSGARWLLARAEEAVGLRAAAVRGDVSGGLRLSGLTYRNDGIDVSVDVFEAAIDLDLVPLSIDVVAATARDVDVTLLGRGEGSAPDKDTAAALEKAVLPMPLRLSRIAVDGLAIRRSGETRIIDSLLLRARWHESVEVERLDLRAPEFDVAVSGVIDLRAGNTLHADAAARLEPALTGLADPLDVTLATRGNLREVDIEADVRAFASVKGTVAFADDRIRISDATIRSEGTDARVGIDADVDRRTNAVTGRLIWEHLRWPLDEARIRSRSGDLKLDGTLDAWSLAGTMDVGTDEFPDGRFEIDGRGTRDAFAGRLVDSDVFGGRAAGQLAFELAGERAWSAALDVANIRLDALLPAWPGHVSGYVDAQGALAPFSLSAELRDIVGQVRGMKLTAAGAIDFRDDVLTATQLRIAHGASRLTVDGAPMTAQGLRFDADVENAGAYSDVVAGRVVASGRLSLVDHAASLTARIESPDFGIAGNEFDDLLVTLGANDDEQTLLVSATHRATPFAIGIAGRFADWRRPLDSPFEGRIDRFEIDLEDRHTMGLVAAAPLSASTKSASLDALCVSGQAGSELCASASWEADGNYAANLALSRVPVDIVEHVVSTDLLFDQRASGTVRWRHDREHGAVGGGTLDLTAGTVRSADNPAAAVATGEGRIDFAVQDGQPLRGNLELPLPGRGHVAGNFAMRDVTLGAASGIDGRLDIDINNIRVLSNLSPLIDSASGALRATAVLAGTVGQPAVSGEFAIDQGRFVYLPIGLDIEDVNLAGTMDSDFRVDVAGTFRAGGGYGEIVSRADYSDAADRGLQFRLRGDDLVLINVPDVMVRVDSDIDVRLDRQTLTIDGRLDIPHALIRPTSLASASVAESEDVVIVAGELPDSPEEAGAQSDFEYRGELVVTLGEDVVVDVDLARAGMTGSATFDWRGGVVPFAEGRYDIDGTIAAFGQVLEIAEGFVHFPGVPADEPLVRIRAEREIFGNTQVKRAGVFIDGPARHPTVGAYTVPLTTEERALTLLVTGSDFDYEQGVGSIDFGAYIAPRLFVSYGVGVFERENVISARFDLARGFGVKASSGSKESGIDLNYRFEN